MTKIRGLRSLRSAESGNTLVSFAITLPVLLPLMMGIFEYGLYMFAGANLEAAVREAARFGATGSTYGGASREEHILQIVEDRTLGMLNPQRASVVTTVYPDFAAIGTESGSAGTGGPGEVVLYDVTYSWPAITPIIGTLMEGETLSVSVAIQNEEF